jgi:hypothetical protein
MQESGGLAVFALLRGCGVVRGNAASFERPRLRAALTPPTVESTSSAISSRV